MFPTFAPLEGDDELEELRQLCREESGKQVCTRDLIRYTTLGFLLATGLIMFSREGARFVQNGTPQAETSGTAMERQVVQDWQWKGLEATSQNSRGFVPKDGRLLLGMAPGPPRVASIDEIASKLGGFRSPAYTLFITMPGTIPGALWEFAAQTAEEGAVLVLTTSPDVGLWAINEDAVHPVVAFCAWYESRGRGGCIIRFGHEMNGGWYPWSQQPALFIEKFRLVSNLLRDGTKRSGMMWSPNNGIGYPFWGKYFPQPWTKEFKDMDTNGDGRVTIEDDPYAPFYPGDEHVEWVALTLYWWGLHFPWGENEMPEKDNFVQIIRGTYQGSIGDGSSLPDFYRTYCGPNSSHRKPLAIAETAAFYNTYQNPGPGEYAIKQEWWRQLFSHHTAKHFPQMKLVSWFNVKKPEVVVHGDVVDWSLTSNPTVAQAFTKEVLHQPGSRFISLKPKGAQRKAKRKAKHHTNKAKRDASPHSDASKGSAQASQTRRDKRASVVAGSKLLEDYIGAKGRLPKSRQDLARFALRLSRRQVSAPKVAPGNKWHQEPKKCCRKTGKHRYAVHEGHSCTAKRHKPDSTKRIETTCKHIHHRCMCWDEVHPKHVKTSVTVV